MACDGRFSDTHAQMCALHLAAYDRLTEQVATLDRLVAQAAEPFTAVIDRLLTIPGVGLRTAQVIVAETGADMTRFATPAHLAAWCGLAPANRQSAGKRMRAGTRKGDKYLKSAMVESAWACARTRTRPGSQLRRLVRRFGKGHEKKAATAVAHTLIRIAWTVMARERDYAEDGEDFYDRRVARHREHLAVRYQQALQRLGYQVTLSPIDTDPPTNPRRPDRRHRRLTPHRPPAQPTPTRLRRGCRLPG
jgi:transposase